MLRTVNGLAVFSAKRRLSAAIWCGAALTDYIYFFRLPVSCAVKRLAVLGTERCVHNEAANVSTRPRTDDVNFILGFMLGTVNRPAALKAERWLAAAASFGARGTDDVKFRLCFMFCAVNRPVAVNTERWLVSAAGLSALGTAIVDFLFRFVLYTVDGFSVVSTERRLAEATQVSAFSTADIDVSFFHMGRAVHRSCSRLSITSYLSTHGAKSRFADERRGPALLFEALGIAALVHIKVATSCKRFAAMFASKCSARPLGAPLSAFD